MARTLLYPPLKEKSDLKDDDGTLPIPGKIHPSSEVGLGVRRVAHIWNPLVSPAHRHGDTPGPPS